MASRSLAPATLYGSFAGSFTDLPLESRWHPVNANKTIKAASLIALPEKPTCNRINAYPHNEKQQNPLRNKNIQLTALQEVCENIVSREVIS